MRILLALCVWLLCATPVYAEFPDGSAQPIPVYCSDWHMLAFLIVTEANGQPRPVQAAIGQIIQAEARQRGITICALARFSNFVTPYRYQLNHPDSWQARQWESTPDWALDLSGSILRGEYPPVLPSYHHFDGNWTNPACFVWPESQVCFLP